MDEWMDGSEVEPYPCWVIVIPMNRKHRKCDFDIRVLMVCSPHTWEIPCLIAEKFEFQLSLPETVLPQELLTL